METIRIGNRTYVMGLHWEHHDTMPSAKDIRTTAHKEGRWVVRRRGMAIIQTGYGAPLADHKPAHLYSLAAAVADTKTEPWLGIVDLEDGRYWFVAVRDNNGILPSGDRVGTAAEIQALREEASSLGQWQEFPDWNLADLAEIIKNARTETLRDAMARPWIKPAMGVAACALGVGGGMALWHHHEEQEENLRRAQIARAQAFQAAMIARDTRYQMPWQQTALPGAQWRACQKVVRRLPVDQMGWSPQSVTCTPESWSQQIQKVLTGRLTQATTRVKTQTPTEITVQWRLVPHEGTTLTGPHGQLASDGFTQATHDVRLTINTTQARLLPREQALRVLYGLLRPQGWQVTVATFHSGALSQKGLPGAPSGAPSPPHSHPWKTYQVTLRTDVGEFPGVSRLFNAVPGLRLTHLVTKTGIPGQHWILQGLLYTAAAAPDTSGPVVAPFLPKVR